MYASEEKKTWERIPEIATWILLFFVLIPGTALGYFAENSLPNTPLYPVKRGIETAILTLTSVNNATKTFYQLSLADTRVKETQQIFASSNNVTSADISQLNVVTAQLAAANASINQVTDPTQKAQMQQQLATTVATYKKQLNTISQQLQTTNTNTNPSQNNNTTNTSQNTDTQSNATDTSSSDLTNLTTDQKATLQQTVDDANTQLDAIVSPSPEPTDTPTPTSQPFFNNHHGDNRDRNNGQNDSGDNRQH